ncbi:MAG: hypothetical protein LBV75_07275, partial [Paludibacter sp.]|nr:hypothetical protein [Paludibacter sp.]
KAGFPDVAKPILLSELTTEQNVAEIAYYLGNTYFLENDFDNAANYFAKGIVADPGYPFNEIGQAMLTMKSTPIKEMDAKIKAIINNKAYKAYKKNPQLYVAIAYAYLYNELNNKALEYQAKAKSFGSKTPEVYIVWGDILEKSDIGQACGYYETATLYDPNCTEAYIKFARAYKSVNANLAIGKLTELKNKDAAFVLADRELGDIYYFTKEFGKAAEYYGSYLESGNITNVEDLIRYSMALYWNGDYQKSLDVTSLGIAKSPRNPVLNRFLLYNYTELKQYDKALIAANNLFNNSDGAKIQYFDYRYNAVALKELQQIELAAAAYAKALELDPAHVELWKEMSDMYKNVKDYPNAVNAYNKYMASTNEEKDLINQTFALGNLYYTWGKDTLVTPEIRILAEQKADSIFGVYAEKNAVDYRGNFWRARANLAIEQIEKTNGLAKKYYELTATFCEEKNDTRYNSVIIECYSYLASYYFNMQDAKTSLEYFNKILVIDPNHEKAKVSATYIEEELKKLKSGKK